MIAPPAPFHVLPYAYASGLGDDEGWPRSTPVQRIKRDGRLDAAAKRYGLGAIVIVH